MLHVTNGDCAIEALRAAGVEGTMLSWLDVLHDGPVPAALDFDELSAVRAAWIAGIGWASADGARRAFAERDAALAAWTAHEEVVLWFEHDLFDQLQLLQLLDFFASARRGATALRIVCVGEYLGEASPDRLCELYPQRSDVSAEQLELGCRGWAAFRSSDPSAIVDLLGEDTSALPFLAGALHRHLEQFPSTHNGLSRSEEQGLRAVADGAGELRDAFQRAQASEEARFLGDASFALYLEQLASGTPLLRLTDGGPLVAPRLDGPTGSFWTASVVLTDAGRAVLDGGRDRVRDDGVDRWLGGVHVRGNAVRWRWDAAAGRLLAAEAS